MTGPPPARRTRWVRACYVAWILGYLVGTSTHIADLVFGGTNAYAGFPDGLRLFWVSLIVLDPLIVALLLLRKRVGIVLGAVVIVVDVVVNVTVYTALGGLSPLGVLSQLTFAIVVLASARPLWDWFESSRPDVHREKTVPSVPS